MRRAAGLPVAASILGLALVVAMPARSQPAPPEIPDAVVRKMLELGLQNIHRALCKGLDTCAPATAEEFQSPPISIQYARVAMIAGSRSALATWCDLDADRRSVLPMSRHMREVLRLNERQTALMAVIHGIQQSIIAEQLKARGTCDEATRSKLDAQLPKS